VLVVSYEVLTLLTTGFLLVVHRPLPFGVPVQFRWAGFSMPSAEIEKVCAVLTGALYTLVPAGRWRRRGGWAAVAIVVVIGLSRMRLGVDAPTDVLLGAILGVTVPLLGMRLFAPEESFPVVYGGVHGAHLDLGGARGEAIKRALKEQMSIEVASVEPFGLAGSGRQRSGNARYPSMWKLEIAPAPMTATLIIVLLFCLPGTLSMPGGVAQFVGALGQGGDDATAVLLGKPGQRDRAAHRIHRGLGAGDGHPEAAQSRRVLPRFEGPASQPGLRQLGVDFSGHRLS
jgi:hypothetical protein